jgi:sulfoacetaldehyde acetyltransferase
MAKLLGGPVQLNIPRDYFYGEVQEEIYPSGAVEYGPGSQDLIARAAELLSKAKYPVILAGGGVSMSNAHRETQALAEYLTAPVVNTYLHNDSFPSDHQLSVGPIGYCGSKAAMRTIAKADIVLALGTRLGPFGTLPQYDFDYWPKNAKIVQVDIDGSQFGLSKKTELGILADAGQFAGKLLEALKSVAPKRAKDTGRLEEIQREKAAWKQELDGWSSSTNKLMHPRRFMKEFTDAIPKGSIVATDIGNNCSISNSYLRFDGPRQHIAALSWGNCGFAYGAAMGAKMGAPDRAVFALQGDGAYGISGLSEVMSAVREDIPVIAVVFNNHEWGAEKKNQIDFFDNRFVGVNLPTNPDYDQLARDMGAVGFKVEDYKDVRGVVEEAIRLNKPVVINAVIEGGEKVLAEPFRRDAFLPAVRYLPKYKHLSAV